MKDVEIMQRILPTSYTCEERVDGVHCYSDIGIDDSEWNGIHGILGQIKKSFGNRFSEVFHQTCADNKKFTVYFKTSAKKVTIFNQPQLRVK